MAAAGSEQSTVIIGNSDHDDSWVSDSMGSGRWHWWYRRQGPLLSADIVSSVNKKSPARHCSATFVSAMAAVMDGIGTNIRGCLHSFILALYDSRCRLVGFTEVPCLQTHTWAGGRAKPPPLILASSHWALRSRSQFLITPEWSSSAVYGALLL